MEPTAADVMTREVVVVTPSTPVAEFARICVEDGISGAPVVSVDGRLVGVVSKTDLVPALLEGSLRRAAPEDVRALFNLEEGDFVPDPEAEVTGDGMGTVDDIMQPDPVTVAPGTPVSEVARRMSAARIHRVFVVEGGRLEGIITSLDLLSRFPASARARGRPAKAKGRRRAGPTGKREGTGKPRRAAARGARRRGR